jgi:hypothetical protein
MDCGFDRQDVGSIKLNRKAKFQNESFAAQDPGLRRDSTLFASTVLYELNLAFSLDICPILVILFFNS